MCCGKLWFLWQMWQPETVFVANVHLLLHGIIILHLLYILRDFAEPRPPQRIRINSIDVDAVSVFVVPPSQRKGDVYSTFSLTYR